MSSTYFDSQNAAYVQALYEDFTRNPEAVPRPWREFFESDAGALLDAGLIVVDGKTAGAQASRAEPAVPAPAGPAAPAAPAPPPLPT
ncbi:MAG: hypothetical protein F4068_17135, partial [Gemmatimonadetes bacterium]|nr:hypothetical protein [Gemmatimonadota bacterium]